jgi:hypothetical protein
MTGSRSLITPAKAKGLIHLLSGWLPPGESARTATLRRGTPSHSSRGHATPVELHLRQTRDRTKREQQARLNRCEQQMLRTPRIARAVVVCRGRRAQLGKACGRDLRIASRPACEMDVIVVWQRFHCRPHHVAKTQGRMSIRTVRWRAGGIQGARDESSPMQPSRVVVTERTSASSPRRRARRAR